MGSNPTRLTVLRLDSKCDVADDVDAERAAEIEKKNLYKDKGRCEACGTRQGRDHVQADGEHP